MGEDGIYLTDIRKLLIEILNELREMNGKKVKNENDYP